MKLRHVGQSTMAQRLSGSLSILRDLLMTLPLLKFGEDIKEEKREGFLVAVYTRSRVDKLLKKYRAGIASILILGLPWINIFAILKKELLKRPVMIAMVAERWRF